MTVILSPNQFGDFGLASHTSSLLHGLDDPQDKATLRQLIHVLCPPIDAPRLLEVLTGTLRSVKQYSGTLISPSESFLKIMAALESLIANSHPFLDVNKQRQELHHPLIRRLATHPAWALCIELSRAPESSPILIAAGAEIALSLVKEKPFPKTYASSLRVALKNSDKDGEIIHVDRRPLYQKHFSKIGQVASALFDAPNPSKHGKGSHSFEDRVTQYFFRKQTYAAPKHRQGILDQRCQSPLQLLQSSGELCEMAKTGNHAAQLIIMAFCCGLSAELTRDLPLQPHAPDDWIIVIDIGAGVVKTNIESLFPDSASPSCNTLENYRDANKIIVKPLPKFIASLLANALMANPGARTIGELIPSDEVAGTTLTMPSYDTGIVPSVARFLNSAAPFAIQAGIDRLTVAAITNDFSVLPGSKFYYALVNRKEIWDASYTFFNALDWGEPVNLQNGLAVGSRIAPKREAISNLYGWMVDQVLSIAPGRRYTYLSLVSHHNVYALFCAAITILCLASRKAEKLHFTAAGLDERNLFVALCDKRTGQFPGALPVPINIILSEQIRLWRVHCDALDKRLEKLGLESSTSLRCYLHKVLNRENVQMFFRIFRHRHVALGTSDLSSWWPCDMKLTTNLGRDFWECELHLHGLQSTTIDMLLRHHLLGMECHTSTSDAVLSDWHLEVCKAQEATLKELGIKPVAGLSNKMNRS